MEGPGCASCQWHITVARSTILGEFRKARSGNPRSKNNGRGGNNMISPRSSLLWDIKLRYLFERRAGCLRKCRALHWHLAVDNPRAKRSPRSERCHQQTSPYTTTHRFSFLARLQAVLCARAIWQAFRSFPLFSFAHSAPLILYTSRSF
jgi:hypothetical protein